MCDCAFCMEFSNGITDNKTEYSSFFEKSRVIAEKGTVLIMPTLGCFIKGYILLTTYDHYNSLYECPDSVISDITKVSNTISRVFLNKLDKGMVFFEHGTIKDFEHSAASINHFHLHFLPINESIWSKIRDKYQFDYYSIKSLYDVKNVVNENMINSYMLLSDIDRNIYLVDCNKSEYHSQFLRRVFYEYYYGEDTEQKWNWQKYPYYKIMRETYDMFKGITI